MTNMTDQDKYAARRVEIGEMVLEAFTIGDTDDHREVMEIAEAELTAKDFEAVEVHTQDYPHSIPCILCRLEGKE